MNKQYIQPAREFGFAANTFNLAGEIIRQPESKPQPRPDSTLALFVDHAAVEAGRAIIAGEMMLEC